MKKLFKKIILVTLGICLLGTLLPVNTYSATVEYEVSEIYPDKESADWVVGGWQCVWKYDSGNTDNERYAYWVGSTEEFPVEYLSNIYMPSMDFVYISRAPSTSATLVLSNGTETALSANNVKNKLDFQESDLTGHINITYSACVAYKRVSKNGVENTSHPSKCDYSSYYVGDYNLPSEPIVLEYQIAKPKITSDIPLTKNYNYDDAVSLSLSVKGKEPLSYQWYKNDVAITGATDATFNFGVQKDLSNNGASIYCVVTNDLGTATSKTCVLTANVGTFKPLFSASSLTTLNFKK